MDPAPLTLGVLTQMLTPAVLISACGALVLSTSMRLGRVMDRVRALSESFEDLVHSEAHVELREERQVLLFDLLDTATSRARLLGRTLTALYITLGIFVSTSVALGAVSVTGGYGWLPVVMTWVGLACLLYGCMLLVREAHLALSGVHAEMDFLWKLGQRHAPAHATRPRRGFARLTRRTPPSGSGLGD
jgi:hypothetical protein